MQRVQCPVQVNGLNRVIGVVVRLRCHRQRKVEVLINKVIVPVVSTASSTVFVMPESGVVIVDCR